MSDCARFTNGTWVALAAGAGGVAGGSRAPAGAPVRRDPNSSGGGGGTSHDIGGESMHGGQGASESMHGGQGTSERTSQGMSWSALLALEEAAPAAWAAPSSARMTIDLTQEEDGGVEGVATGNAPHPSQRPVRPAGAWWRRARCALRCACMAC